MSSHCCGPQSLDNRKQGMQVWSSWGSKQRFAMRLQVSLKGQSEARLHGVPTQRSVAAKHLLVSILQDSLRPVQSWLNTQSSRPRVQSPVGIWKFEQSDLASAPAPGLESGRASKDATPPVRPTVSSYSQAIITNIAKQDRITLTEYPLSHAQPSEQKGSWDSSYETSQPAPWHHRRTAARRGPAPRVHLVLPTGARVHNAVYAA